MLWSEILPVAGRKNLNKALSAAGFSEKQIANTHKKFLAYDVWNSWENTWSFYVKIQDEKR